MENLLVYVTFLMLNRRIQGRLTGSSDRQTYTALPHCGRCDATNKEDPTPTQWMTGLENKDVFQEEGIQLSQLKKKEAQST